jgi:hypothetical protein
VRSKGDTSHVTTGRQQLLILSGVAELVANDERRCVVFGASVTFRPQRCTTFIEHPYDPVATRRLGAQFFEPTCEGVASEIRKACR